MFGPYSLDTSRAALTRDGASVPLRPKTFALLSLPGRPSRSRAGQGRVAASRLARRRRQRGIAVAVRARTARRAGQGRAGVDQDGGAPAATCSMPPCSLQERPSSRASAPGRAPAGWAVLAAVLLASLTSPCCGPIARSMSTRPSRRTVQSPSSRSARRRRGSWRRRRGDHRRPGDRPRQAARHPGAGAGFGRRGACAPRTERKRAQRGRRTAGEHATRSSDDGTVLWSERFDELADIGARIAAHARCAADDGAAATRSATQERARSTDAIDETLQGQLALRNFVSRADLLRARTHFEKALAVEPDSAAALTGLAQSYLSEVGGPA